MSVQFGRWNFDGQPVDADYISKVSALLKPFAPDSLTICVKQAFALLFGAFCTTPESREERQPIESQAGLFLMWDGRLDNREELIANEKRNFPTAVTDAALVASLFNRSGTGCFSRLIGDWALSIWDENHHSVVLAKDFLGVRSLYYVMARDHLAWSTILDPLVGLANHPLCLSEEYLAGCFSGYAAAHLTPYREILSVPPASVVEIRTGRASARKYWDFSPRQAVRLRDDREYEGRFRTLFGLAVRRRLRSDRTVLAELSGGMDSSSIVCMADLLLRCDGKDLLPVETVSFFDDAEPNWNEKPFFTAVESQRGQPGLHINVGTQDRFLPERDDSRFPVTPWHGARRSEPQKKFAEHIARQEFRVLLSGTGGDETTGGVPTGIPELADLLARARGFQFFHQAFLWALATRQSILQIVGKTLHAFASANCGTSAANGHLNLWLSPAFARRYRCTLQGTIGRLRLFGPMPSLQANLQALEMLRGQMASAPVPSSPCYETRYPFLDRDLLEFLYNLPREQVVRPNQRRSLLRRALRGIVPAGVLERRRKGYVTRGPQKAIGTDWERVAQLTEDMVCATRGILGAKEIRATLERARNGEDIPLVPLMRVLRIEWWMRDPKIRKLFSDAHPTTEPLAVLRPRVS